MALARSLAIDESGHGVLVARQQAARLRHGQVEVGGQRDDQRQLAVVLQRHPREPPESILVATDAAERHGGKVEVATLLVGRRERIDQQRRVAHEQQVFLALGAGLGEAVDGRARQHRLVHRVVVVVEEPQQVQRLGAHPPQQFAQLAPQPPHGADCPGVIGPSG